jgi:hypothetical protein
MNQINTRLSSEARAQFDTYAVKVGLDAGELARLLIVRELHTRRALPLLARRPVKNSSEKTGQRKLTAHFHKPDDVANFDKHADAYGLTRAAAAKLIFERELTEMWLLRALKWSPRARTSADERSSHNQPVSVD